MKLYPAICRYDQVAGTEKRGAKTWMCLSLLVDMREPDPIRTPIQKLWHTAKRCGDTLLREMSEN